MGASFLMVAVLPADDFVALAPGLGSLFALTRTGIVQRSEDWGLSWSPTGRLGVSDAVGLCELGSALFVLAGTGEASRSIDGGATWTAVGTISQVGTIALAHDSDGLVAATRAGEVATSLDGAIWTWRGTMNQLAVSALGTDVPVPSSVPGESPGTPLSLRALWPNPWRAGGGTNLSLDLSREDQVQLRLFDTGGRLVAERRPERIEAGPHVLRWNPGPLPSGAYLLQLVAGTGGRHVAKLTVLD
jgi:hypothetical protein